MRLKTISRTVKDIGEDNRKEIESILGRKIKLIDGNIRFSDMLKASELWLKRYSAKSRAQQEEVRRKLWGEENRCKICGTQIDKKYILCYSCFSRVRNRRK